MQDEDMDDRRPLLMIVVGRQRVGKTSFLNTTTQFMRSRGASFEVWDADKLNTTYNMSLFCDDAKQPPSADPEDVKEWLDARCGDLVERGIDAVLDIGGGDTPLGRLVEDMPFVATLEREGARVVLVHVVGPELADLDYLARFSEGGLLAADATLIVLNTGLILTGRSTEAAFAQVMEDSSVGAAVMRGARVITMPRLSCMSQVTDRELTFDEAMSGRSKNGGRPLSMFDKARVRIWWEEHLPAMYVRIPPLWLPKMRADEPLEGAPLFNEEKKRAKASPAAGIA